MTAKASTGISASCSFERHKPADSSIGPRYEKWTDQRDDGEYCGTGGPGGGSRNLTASSGRSYLIAHVCCSVSMLSLTADCVDNDFNQLDTNFGLNKS